jgi:hypothetical protein
MGLSRPVMGLLYLFLPYFEVIHTVHYIYVKVKVKVTLEQATKAQTGSRGIALLFL